MGGRHNKTHTACVRCGRTSWHIQRGECGACGAGTSARRRHYNWGKKAQRRRTTGTGRLRHLTKVHEQYAGIKKTQVKYNVAVARARKVIAKKVQ